MEVLKMSNKQLAIIAGVLFVAVLTVFATKEHFVGPHTEHQNWSEWNNAPILGNPEPIKEEEAPPAEEFHGPQLSPKTFREALIEADRSKKNIFLYFETDECTWCEKMKATTFADPEVRKQLADYVVYFCNAKEERVLSHKFSVHGVPCYYIINANQRILNKAQGYKSAKDFISWLN